MDCIFCKIVAGEIPASKVYEDDKCLAFLDINPMMLGHTLLIPKRHAEFLTDIPQKDYAAIFSGIQKVVTGILKGLRVDGANVLQSNGKAAGQAVPHVHFHIVPRKRGDGLNFYPAKRAYSAEDLKQAEDAIREACGK